MEGLGRADLSRMYLPDPPDSLAGPARGFYVELLRMLQAVQPTEVDRQTSTVRFQSDAVDVRLRHARRREWEIWATVGDKDAIVATDWAHEHFFAPPDNGTEERPWTTEIVDFVAEILRGEIEVDVTLRGKRALSMRHYNRDERGERRALG